MFSPTALLSAIAFGVSLGWLIALIVIFVRRILERRAVAAPAAHGANDNDSWSGLGSAAQRVVGKARPLSSDAAE